MLTLLRIIIIPIIVLSFYFDDTVFAHKISGLLFLFASLTDFFDGYLARKYHLESRIGKILDPIADKVLIASILLMLVKFNKAQEIPCLLILSREFIIGGLRELGNEFKITLNVSNLAKVKTFVQMLAILVLLIGTKGSGIKYFDLFGSALLWIAAFLTLATGFMYLQVFWKKFEKSRKN